MLLQQLASQSTQPQSKMASSSEGLEDKRLRALQKKLRQIEELKERKSKGERLEASQVITSKLKTVCYVVRSHGGHGLCLFSFTLQLVDGKDCQRI